MELLFFGFWLICGFGAAMIASSKGRSGCGWFIGGVLFGPIALLVIGFMAPATNTSSTSTLTASNTDAQSQRVKCPYCAELIMPDAKICRFCGRDVQPASRTAAGSLPAAKDYLNVSSLIASVSSEPLTLSAGDYYKQGYKLMKSKQFDSAKLEFARTLSVSEPGSRWYDAAKTRLEEMKAGH